jgi:hypothetical protein
MVSKSVVAKRKLHAGLGVIAFLGPALFDGIGALAHGASRQQWDHRQTEHQQTEDAVF